MKGIFKFLINVLVIVLLSGDLALAMILPFIYAIVIGKTELYYFILIIHVITSLFLGWGILYALSHSRLTKIFPWSKYIYYTLGGKEYDNVHKRNCKNNTQ